VPPEPTTTRPPEPDAPDAIDAPGSRRSPVTIALAAAVALVLVIIGVVAVWPRHSSTNTGTVPVTITETSAAPRPGCLATWTTTARGGWHGEGPDLGVHHQQAGQLTLGVATRDWDTRTDRYLTGARFRGGSLTVLMLPDHGHLGCFGG
jgi:hypothetical protein